MFMRCYHFSPDVYVERFDDDVILFLADRDLMLTVNLAAGELYETARSVIGDRSFSHHDCMTFLIDTYVLTEEESRRQTRSILTFGLRHRILVKGEPN